MDTGGPRCLIPLWAVRPLESLCYKNGCLGLCPNFGDSLETRTENAVTASGVARVFITDLAIEPEKSIFLFLPRGSVVGMILQGYLAHKQPPHSRTPQ